jgi:hypothetical protein
MGGVYTDILLLESISAFPKYLEKPHKGMR